MRKRVVIGLGSNAPDRHEAVTDAVKWLRTKLTDVYACAPYPTEYEGETDDDRTYLNAVASGFTDLPSDILTCMLKEYETAHGRVRRSGINNLVTIDLDLVIYDDTIVKSGELSKRYFLKGFDLIKSHRSN